MFEAQTGRQREATLIRQANRASAMGRLMLGELKDWQQFIDADQMDLSSLPRRQLKSGAADVKERLSGEIRKFCNRNFHGITDSTLHACTRR